MVRTAVFEAGSFVINQRGGMIEGSISRVMYCDHIEVDHTHTSISYHSGKHMLLSHCFQHFAFSFNFS